MIVTVAWYMSLAAVLFSMGAAGVLMRRNALVMFMSIELMLNSVNLTFVAAGSGLGLIEGQVAALFVMVVAAAEVVVGNFGVAQLSPIVISSVVATVVSRFALGNHPAFPVPPYELVSPFELIPYMGVGFVAGFVALAFMLMLYATEDLFDKIRMPEYMKACLGGLCVGAIGIALVLVSGIFVLLRANVQPASQPPSTGMNAPVT